MGANPEATAGDATAKMTKAEKKMTKRQKRKQVNEKNKWPQHPKIQDMEVRSKAYVRVAGLGSSTKKKESIDPTLDLMSPEVKFGRLLGSTEPRKRHAAVQKLKAYLKARCDITNEKGGISEMDLLKLWKGMWYTLYMADKVPVQDELSKHLASLVWCVAGTEEEDEFAGQAYLAMCEDEIMEDEEDVDEEGDSDDPDVTLEEVENSLEQDTSASEEEEDGTTPFDQGDDESKIDHETMIDDSEIKHCRGAHLVSLLVRTFFRTIRREWGNMDKYRVDKFYTLSRMYIHEIYSYMAKRHWNIGIIRLFNDAVFEEVLSKKPNGLRYHLVDVALEELTKVNKSAPLPLTEATFLDVLEPYLAMCQTGGGDDSVQRRVMEQVLEKFLEKYSIVSEDALQHNVDQEEDSFVLDEVHVETVGQFIFDLASDSETKDKYRKSLYDMHKTYMRRIKKVGKDVVLEQPSAADAEMDDDGHVTWDEDVDETDVDILNVKNSDEDSLKKEEEKEAVSKKGKKKKKRKQAQAESKEKVKETSRKKKKTNSKEKIDLEEEVVTISLGDQKKAREKEKKKASKELKAKETVATSSAADKRVKWLPNNKSKSHKASIKGLARATPPKTSEVTPEKSILLNKGKVRRTIKTSGRKKAVNYF